jgi:hypothetical protein
MTNKLLEDAVFFVSIATIGAGLLKFIISYMLKSKCSDFNMCWGMIKIKRDIGIERDIEIAQINNNIHNDELNEPIQTQPQESIRL